MTTLEKLKTMPVFSAYKLERRCEFCTADAVVDCPTNAGHWRYLCLHHADMFAVPYFNRIGTRIK